MSARWRIIGGTALFLGAATVLYMLDPERTGILPSCPLHTMTGLWCPGCGTTRALHQLLHGHLAAAFRFNPLAISLLPLVGYLALRREKIVINPKMIWILLGMIIAFGVLRNIPTFPFTLLSP